MPPKTSQPSKKTEQKKLDKIVDDKTFGLKNKNKSKTVQNFVKSVANQVKGLNNKGGESKRIADEFAEKAAKKKEEEKKALLNNLFKSVKKVQEEVEEEPEEVAEDKYEEIDYYVDQREQIFGGGGEVPEELANWQNNKVDRMCKNFLEAAEAGKYGWRWVCANGIGCIYRHALPAGFTLKRDMPLEEKRNVGAILEEELEIERSQLRGGTPITLERFLKWKEDKKKQRADADEKKRVEEAKKSGGKGLNVLSGRALFTYDPTLFKDDEEAVENEEYERISEEEEDDEDGEEGEEGEDGENGEQEEEEKQESAPAEEEDEEEIQARNKPAVIRDWGGDNGVTGIVGTQEAAKKAAAEKKKKKKKKVVKKEEEDNVKINEDVFLGEEDIELPEDV